MSWEEAWREGRTGWDAGESSPVLQTLVESGDLPVGRALVPGCGSGYDVFTLVSDQRHATGLELAPTAAGRFDQLREARNISSERATIVIGDFLQWVPEQSFDLIWDYTFFCAIDPSQRTTWASQMNRLLSDDGELVTLVFPVGDWPGPSDPPYRVTPELLVQVLAPHFEPASIEAVVDSHPGRQGHEFLGRWRKRPR